MWYLNRVKEDQSNQTSFVGGKPWLPVDCNEPKCSLCESDQAFMFQVAFPNGAEWAGRTLAVFACMKCVDQNYLIPEMLNATLQGANIPAGFLNTYQRNFAFLVFETSSARAREMYVEQVKFFALEQSETVDAANFGKIGGRPKWVSGNEAPAEYDSCIPMVFLMQLAPDLRFTTVDGASPQIKLDLSRKPTPSRSGDYRLFLGNPTYLFGTSQGEPLVYAITQV